MWSYKYFYIENKIMKSIVINIFSYSASHKYVCYSVRNTWSFKNNLIAVQLVMLFYENSFIKTMFFMNKNIQIFVILINYLFQ